MRGVIGDGFTKIEWGRARLRRYSQSASCIQKWCRAHSVSRLKAVVMRIVNPHMISAVLAPFLSLPDDELALWAGMSVSMEHEVKARIRSLLVPYFYSFDRKSREVIKDSLGYLLVAGYDGWGDLLSSTGCPIDFWGDERLFFEWLWDELFHEAIGLEEAQSSYIVSDDFHAPNLIKRGL